MRLCMLRSAPAFLPTLYTFSLHAAVAPVLLRTWYTLSLLAAVYPSIPTNLLHFVSERWGCPSTPANLVHFVPACCGLSQHSCHPATLCLWMLRLPQHSCQPATLCPCLLPPIPAHLPTCYTFSLNAAVTPSTPANLLHFACLQPYQVMLCSFTTDSIFSRLWRHIYRPRLSFCTLW